VLGSVPFLCQAAELDGHGALLQLTEQLGPFVCVISTTLPGWLSASAVCGYSAAQAPTCPQHLGALAVVAAFSQQALLAAPNKNSPYQHLQACRLLCQPNLYVSTGPVCFCELCTTEAPFGCATNKAMLARLSSMHSPCTV